MIRFYRWLRKFASEKTRQYVHCNIKCPHCKTWSSEIEGDIVEDKGWGYIWKCGQCGKDTVWNSVAFPFPTRADNRGNPITIEKSETF